MHRGRITWSGDRIPERESAVVLANHRGWFDFYLIHALAQHKRMLDSCKFFVKVGNLKDCKFEYYDHENFVGCPEIFSHVRMGYVLCWHDLFEAANGRG